MHVPSPDSVLAPAVAVAERWADFTKMYAIYPEANQRVQEALGTFLEALREAVDAAGGESEIEVLFHHEALRAGGVQSELRAGTNLKWLHDRVHKSALAGVAFAPDVPEESIFLLTRLLLSHFTRQTLDDSFAELWPESYEGLRLVERRFEGRFDDEGVTGGGLTRSWGGSAPPGVDVTDEEDLVALLAAEDRIQRRLERLKEHLAQAGEPDEEREQVDILGRLVHLLPKDAIQEFESFVGLTTEVLDRLEERIKGGTDARIKGLNQLLFAASRSLLAREKEDHAGLAARLTKERAEQEAARAEASNGEASTTLEKDDGPRGHAGDEKITDDRALLLEELEAFPAPAPDALSLTELESKPETLDVLLHELVATGAPELAERIHELLRQVLESPGPAEVATLRAYLTAFWHRADDEGAGPEFDRLLDFLLDTRQGSLLRQEGFLPTEVVVQSFPRFFGLYVDSLDPAQPEHQAELKWLLEAIGPEMLNRERPALLQKEKLLDGNRLTRLFAWDSPLLMPLARLALELGEGEQKREATAYLKRLGLESREACLLRLTDDPFRLPLSYLLSLASPYSDGSYPPELGRDVGLLLCREIEVLADDPHAVMKRVEAINALGNFRSTESKKLLVSLVKKKRLLVLASEPSEVREAAKHVLQLYGVI